MAELIFVKLGMYIMTPETVSATYFINPSLNLCLYKYPLIAARQRFGKNLAAAYNKHAAIEELLGE
jgi:hypothetical protein